MGVQAKGTPENEDILHIPATHSALFLFLASQWSHFDAQITSPGHILGLSGIIRYTNYITCCRNPCLARAAGTERPVRG